jgi:hypothetical protein
MFHWWTQNLVPKSIYTRTYMRSMLPRRYPWSLLTFCDVRSCGLVKVYRKIGRAIARTASRRLPTAEARVRAQVKSCVICCGRSDTGAGFLRVLRFPLPILIPPTSPHSSSGAGTIGQLVWPHPKKMKKLKLLKNWGGGAYCFDHHCLYKMQSFHNVNACGAYSTTAA